MKKAIILGAGPAGLTAAYELLTKTAILPVIIEQGDQVGGLARTVNYKGNLIDLGGHRFFSKSERIIDWWLQFLPLETSAAEIALRYQNQEIAFHPKGHPAGTGRMLIRQRKSRIYFEQAFFDYPLSLNAHTLSNFGFPALARIGSSYLSAKLFPIKNEATLEDFFINRFGKDLYTRFFQGYTEKIWGVPCNQIPADWGRQRIKDLNIGKAIRQAIKSIFSSNQSLQQRGVSTSLIEQFMYPEKGPGQLWETVAEKIIALGGEIHLNTRVEKIAAAGASIHSVAVRDHSGNVNRLTGDYFFSSIPIQHLIGNLEGMAIPENVQQTAAALAYRDFIIVGLLFEKSAGGVLQTLTDNWIYLQDKEIRAGRMQLFNNWSPEMVANPEHVWIGMEYFCSDTDALWNQPEEAMIALALEEIRKIGLIRQEVLLDATVIKVPKAYPSYIGAYDQFPMLQEFLDAIENLFVVGRNGMHRYNNTDHSMMTAMTAVENIIARERDRSNIWAVNMEQEFLEEKGQV